MPKWEEGSAPAEVMQTPIGKKAEEAAIHEAIQARVIIRLEKEPGSDTYKRHIEASSASAAMNGLAVLIREFAGVLETTPVSVLALLATVLTVPAIREEQEGQE